MQDVRIVFLERNIEATILSHFPLWSNLKPDEGQAQSGKYLYKGKVHYCLYCCQLTLSLAVGKEENKSCVFQNNLLKS